MSQISCIFPDLENFSKNGKNYDLETSSMEIISREFLEILGKTSKNP